MYTIVALIPLLTFVNAAPRDLSGRTESVEQIYCCNSLKNPTYFSSVASKGMNAGDVGYNCTRMLSVVCAEQIACCSGVVEAKDDLNVVHGCRSC